ncbi:MAG: D-hexose-6-phosphate mutarotase [Burkholderiales bacterium]|nr:D-hexose-6-phosphate mutarotase [Burkholderiales bacterium]
MNSAQARAIATVPGEGGMPKLVVVAADGARIECYLHGAHVTSWQTAAREERLYLSPRAQFVPGGAIRGGIPLCFPQFADQGPLPLHGFARNHAWTPLFAGRTTAGAAEVRLGLADSSATRSVWPHPFACEFVATAAADALTVTLTVTNTGATAFAFTAALHTYLRVRDVHATVVEGLTHARYRDKRRGIDDVAETAPALTLTEPLDRVYHTVPERLRVREPDHALVVRATGSTDTVVWNPGPPTGPGPHDMPDDGYRTMLCVEAAIARAPRTLAPGATHALVQHLCAATPGTAMREPSPAGSARPPR